jgi:glutathione-regulated potassium-efflux system ancillary protein KefC
MSSELLLYICTFLAAACLVVPLAKRLRLGSVLGYLLAGIAIGPFGLKYIENPETILHFAEFGVVMMLFLIGLELEPARLLKMRRAILGLGGSQVIATTLAISAAAYLFGLSIPQSLAIGMALSLSSTALGLQMLEEKGLMNTAAGESSFAVLLFQDLAVIPILLLFPLLSNVAASPGHEASLIEGLPGWVQAFVVGGVLVGLTVAMRYASRHAFRVIAKTELREIFTAASLLLIFGTTLLMQSVGLSPALGAFIAGVVLANSEYRHTLMADIRPFKGLLLGLFFISVGMGMNFSLLATQPGMIALTVLALMALKCAILLACGFGYGMRDGQNTLFALTLAQGGEFAFVLFQYAGTLDLLGEEQRAFLTLAVALSMAATPLIIMLNERFIVPRFLSRLPEPRYDNITPDRGGIIIAGYGRVGQVIGRFLHAQGIEPTVLEKDPDQVALLRRFGNRGFFGDASRLELLHAAGAKSARILVIAINNPEKCLEIARIAKAHFPNLVVYARARNRRHAYELYKLGVDYFHRDTFDSALTMARDISIAVGVTPETATRKIEQFREFDMRNLRESFTYFEHEPELISFVRQAAGEMERILREDEAAEDTEPQRA